MSSDRNFLGVILFWSGAIVLVVGLSYVVNGLWPIFQGWGEASYPQLTGMCEGCSVDFARVVSGNAPVAIEGSGVLIVGFLMMVKGERRSNMPTVQFGLFLGGVITLIVGLASLLFGLSSFAFNLWYDINFGTQSPGVPRGLLFPQLWVMPYIVIGLFILVLGVFMMKSGRRKPKTTK